MVDAAEVVMEERVVKVQLGYTKCVMLTQHCFQKVRCKARLP